MGTGDYNLNINTIPFLEIETHFNNMEQILKDIQQGRLKGRNQRKEQEVLKNKKNWYKIGKAIKNGHKVKLHNKGKLAAKRTYQYYKIDKGNWEGPTPWRFGKMVCKDFEEVLKGREPRGEILLDSTPVVPQTRDFTLEDIVNFMWKTAPQDNEELLRWITGSDAIGQFQIITKLDNPTSDPTFDLTSNPISDSISDFIFLTN